MLLSIFLAVGAFLLAMAALFYDFAERNESLLVLVRVVAKADVHLRRAAVGHRKRECHTPARHGLTARVIGNCALAPALRNDRIAVDPELRPLAFHHSKEARIIEITARDQIVESIRTLWRPRPMHLNDDRAFARLQSHFEIGRRQRER